MNINLIITIEQLSDIDSFENELKPLVNENYEKIISNGFDGVDKITYLLTVGGGLIVTQIANILVNLFKRNNCKKIKINDIEITGYSLEETLKIIEELLKMKDSTKK